MQMSCGEAIARMLKEEGVEKAFGIIDGTYFGLYSSFEKYGIELITPRHETSAAHMAGAYARTTGKLGVCLASNGPGVANILPGAVVENVEGNRVLLITSCRRHQIISPDRGGSYQTFSQTKVIRPVSKYSERIPTPERTVEIVRQAFRKSYQGRPGLVHIDVPENFMNGKFKFSESDFIAPEKYRNTQAIQPRENQVDKAVELLINAKNPIIHAGSGVIHARGYEELELLANTLHSPVTSSWGARGALCEENDLSMPMIYIDVNNELRTDADLVLVLGSRISETDWWGKRPNWGNGHQTWIQVDTDEEYIGRNRPVDLGIQSDVKEFMRAVNTKLQARKNEINIESRKIWYNTYISKRDKARNKLNEHLKDMSAPLNSAHISSICKKEFNSNAIAVFDGGNTAVWGQFFHKCTNPGGSIGTPKMGMLGAGQGQALGAQVAHPDKQVYALMGDGAMGFHMQEVETAVRNDLPVIFLVACDNQWGMVKINQQFALKPIKTMIKKSLDESETINAD
ncbi:MAG: thiamine pyrophosphate-binding protein, partial [Bacteriovoracaceae bacterium]|nr:thiamine pyrophosphate-binding protein [Bacteriovoracaceae bacterium]